MNLKLAVDLSYRVSSMSTLILNLLPLKTSGQQVFEENIQTEPGLQPQRLGPDQEGSLYLRYEVPKTRHFRFSYQGRVANNFTLSNHEHDDEVFISRLNSLVLTYLHPSRYCQSDMLYRFAKNQFGSIPNPFEQVTAINAWINRNVEYASGSTNANTSAHDTITEQIGVCRDFAHLGIALCRALTIPARYFSCYAYGLNPPDFHACYEAYLGGTWVLFDPTGLVSLNCLVKIATGRDAADTAIGSTFGEILLETIKVSCDLEEQQSSSFKLQAFQGISYSQW